MKRKISLHGKMTVKALSLLLCLVMVLGSVPLVFAEEATSQDVTTILACSDFQAEAGNASGTQQVKAILSAMAKDGITSADGFFCCGDYDYEYDDTQGGIAALKSAVKDVVSDNMVFAQGNHDPAVGTVGLSTSGNNDPSHGKYGVFVINEDDYMWYNERELMIQRTAQLLTDYLNEKIEEGYDKPIFVLSHLPLHYNMRTQNDGDGRHAGYLVDVLNEAGAKGLNLFFLFGHDHSNGWDDYLGGSSIYLKKGDSMLVSSTVSPPFVSTTLQFTYMNAGYTGYYSNVNGADAALTMTYITISDNEVTIARYAKDGVHDLKSAGVRNRYKNEIAYVPNSTVYPSPQVVPLTSLADKTPITDLLKSDPMQKMYRRVNSAEEIKDGGKYVIVYNSSTDRILLPQEVTKSDDAGTKRIGFEIELSAAFGGDIVYGDFAEKEWTFTKSGDGWLMGAGDQYAAFTKTALYEVTATLEDEGSVFSVEGTRDAFTLKSGSYSYNYNSRMLFNGYNSDPAHFYLYEAVGYQINVTGGTVANGTTAMAGESVTVTADAAPEGQVFDRWIVKDGAVDLGDATALTVSFTMPQSGVVLQALYQDASSDGTPDTGDEGSAGTLLVLGIVIGAVIGFDVAFAVFMILRKKKIIYLYRHRES